MNATKSIEDNVLKFTDKTSISICFEQIDKEKTSICNL